MVSQLLVEVSARWALGYRIAVWIELCLRREVCSAVGVARERSGRTAHGRNLEPVFSRCDVLPDRESSF